MVYELVVGRVRDYGNNFICKIVWDKYKKNLLVMGILYLLDYFINEDNNYYYSYYNNFIEFILFMNE